MPVQGVRGSAGDEVPSRWCSRPPAVDTCVVDPPHVSTAAPSATITSARTCGRGHQCWTRSGGSRCAQDGSGQAWPASDRRQPRRLRWSQLPMSHQEQRQVHSTGAHEHPRTPDCRAVHRYAYRRIVARVQSAHTAHRQTSAHTATADIPRVVAKVEVRCSARRGGRRVHRRGSLPGALKLWDHVWVGVCREKGRERQRYKPCRRHFHKRRHAHPNHAAQHALSTSRPTHPHAHTGVSQRRARLPCMTTVAASRHDCGMGTLHHAWGSHAPADC